MSKLRLVKQGEFLGIKCDFFEDQQGEIWMTREQVGRALEYKDPSDAIRKIHARSKARLDRFSVEDKMSGTDSKKYSTYLYSTKGIYEIISLSNQPNAREFMDWVYDVLDAIRTGRISQQVLRDAGITVRRTMTDSIRDNVEESPNKRFVYKNYTELVYKHVFGMNSKELRLSMCLEKDKKIRDHLTAEELEAVLTVERQVSTLVDMYLSYEDIKGILNKKQVVRSLPRTRERIASEKAN